MFTGIPNLLTVFGYFRASWTLRVDLIGDFVCRLLKHMDLLGVSVVTPALREVDGDMVLRPWVDPADFNPGYLARSLALLPQQGDRDPWRNGMTYFEEKEVLPLVDLNDGSLLFK
jgi:cation diffusion facilitator CzcD-associated flavoprotein CzcO